MATTKGTETGPQYAGEFRLEEFKIINHTGTEVNLEESFVELNIYESITSSAVSADIVFLDTNDSVNLLPLIGNEYVKILVSTPATDKSGSIDYRKHTFVIREITANEDAGQGKVVGLSLVTAEMVTNTRVRISQSFSGAYSEMVSNIFTAPNYLNSKKDLHLEDTSGSHNVVIPNMKPFKAISMLAQRSLSEITNPTFLFYEDTRGYNFRSLESLYSEPDVATYTAGIADDNQDNAKGVESNLYQIEKHSIIHNSDMLNKTMTGLYSSKIIIHDIYNKSYQTHTFSYKDDFERGFDTESMASRTGHPLFPNSILDDKENTISDFSDAQVQLQSTSSSGNIYATDTYPNARTPYGKSNPGQDLIIRRSKIGMLSNGLTMQLTMNGNTGIKAGDMINVRVFKTGSEVGDMFDKRLSGRYIISKLRHYFTRTGDKKHRIVVEVTKNSVIQPYPSDLKPMPKAVGKIKKVSSS